MSHPYEHTRFVLHEVPNLKGKCVLDVGCGKGIWGYFLRSEYDENVFMVGLDIWKDYLKHSKRHNVYDDYVLADASRLPFRDKGFDIILACEVIEHMPKSRSWSFLKELERVCRHKIILTTPNGFWPQIISVLNPPDIHNGS
jgi:ubiquinone/menaquinone biosynthesis C-methylase UbiE